MRWLDFLFDYVLQGWIFDTSLPGLVKAFGFSLIWSLILMVTSRIVETRWVRRINRETEAYKAVRFTVRKVPSSGALAEAQSADIEAAVFITATTIVALRPWYKLTAFVLSLFGKELKRQGWLLAMMRRDVRNKLAEHALTLGAHEVVCLRYIDMSMVQGTNKMPGVCAYGTALVPRQRSKLMGRLD